MVKKVLMFIAPGTEATEFIATYDILKRANIEVTLLGENYHMFDFDNHVSVFSMKSYSFEEYDTLIFPGGRRGVDWMINRLVNNVKGDEIKEFFLSKKLVAAICAAPSLLGKLGLLKDRNFTCYPGFEGDFYNGNYTAKEIEIDRNLITGRSMYYSVDFGLAIVEYLLGKDERLRVEKQVKGLK